MLRVLSRLALLQGSWNYDRMLGLGLAWALAPRLDARAVGRATGHFNAHPYLAGLAAGAVARMEAEGAPPADVDRLRDALPGPLGSIGDDLFWAGVLPSAAGLGLIAAALVGPLAGVLVLLAVHNVAHVPVRVWALRRGWALGREVARALGTRWLARLRRGATVLAPLAIGFALAPVLAWQLAGPAATWRWVAIGVAAATFVAHRLAPGVGTPRFALLVAVAALVGGYL